MLIRHRKVVLAVLMLCVFSFALTAERIETGKDGMVVSANQLASDAGALILQLGGNAVDAAAAVGFALCVVEPYGSNLGGEGYMLLSLADGRDIAIDYKSQAPGHVAYDHDVSQNNGPEATCIPGVVAGLSLAVEQYGTLPLSVVLAPAIQYARYGFPVDPVMFSALGSLYDSIEDPLTDETIAPIFFPDGLIPEVGTILYNEPQAKALELIAEDGAEAFYRGDIADAIVETMGGFFTSADLQRYQAVVRDALISEYRGLEIIGAPAIISGATIAQILNILDNFDMSIYTGWDDPEFMHLLSQAQLLGAADLGFMLDPDFYEIPYDALLSQEYADGRAALIDLETTFPYQGTPAGDPWGTAETVGVVKEPPSFSTTHYSVLDKDGNAVSTTQTLSSFWGSKVFVPEYGFFMNNEIHNFQAYDPENPDNPQAIGPYKSPLTILVPTVVRNPDGSVYMVGGTSGGINIVSTVSKILVSVIDLGMTLDEAILAPRFTAMPFYPVMLHELGFPEETMAALAEKGHGFYPFPDPGSMFGSPNFIIVDEDGLMTGVATFRRDGGATAP
ncbi:gamma-glutamyltransferase family protein [Candidatus Bipolaricaulota bacterium]